ncbi:MULTISPECIES: Na(+)/H(+) antiporter subunit F1 [unclassified Planococcus (in: firmicutes)]|uniref:Na(+)/H(+) antiporter subunit F1 n=1 Tax=Planococcus TaxID=1372 RepID=UPI000C31DB68|nr:MULTISPECIES: Na(+)/H(+) antiporter subunit F1 [unclassified Planococcus (in: firmicutes)]AUD13202.1 Na(+)/H(+) antiporter subunit F [Planococcus sp. MB-3u-03]PKG45310.1 Na(+)/H(+) antiporter subunit F [Planococcus sp. Urea-trap-24]PKG89094.1 Na(+)/H(+) antiporter subunit F [Planococcus sp. Urea-3u-39]PKH39309.1 Na(+)/H(+) antiporter subunit F [Planococcus sp. MB-3u-09]
MIDIILTIALSLFVLAILLALYRIIRGPSMPDRVVALDMIGVNLISAVAVFSVFLKTHVFLEVILVVGILAFISTIALARFVERGDIVEHKHDQ